MTVIQGWGGGGQFSRGIDPRNSNALQRSQRPLTYWPTESFLDSDGRGRLTEAILTIEAAVSAGGESGGVDGAKSSIVAIYEAATRPSVPVVRIVVSC